MVGSCDSNAAAPMAAGPGTGTGLVAAPTKVDIADEPPPPPAKPTPPRAPISGGVLTAKPSVLPKPAYPPIARAAHASGTVVVQVTIDENGNVISATRRVRPSAVAGGGSRQLRAERGFRRRSSRDSRLRLPASSRTTSWLNNCGGHLRRAGRGGPHSADPC